LRSIALITGVGAALAVAVFSPVAGAGTAAVTRAPGQWCGGTLWKLETLSDTTRYLVYPTPIRTTIPAIAALTPPRRIPASRRTGFQRQVWQLRVVIDRYRLQSNGEIALELYDIPSGMYMNAYIPNPRCLSETSTRNRSEILAARAAFTRACPAPTPAWQLLGATALLAGVGFWNPVRTTLGALGNGAELRPVTRFDLLQGCGKYG
jgi:hypothetical protein